jgi:hypothetical protein
MALRFAPPLTPFAGRFAVQQDRKEFLHTMTTQPFQSRNGETLLKPVLTEEEYRSFQNDYAGFCLGCGETADNVEPDARQYICESCSRPRVYGFEELLLMNLIVLQ